MYEVKGLSDERTDGSDQRLIIFGVCDAIKLHTTIPIVEVNGTKRVEMGSRNPSIKEEVFAYQRKKKEAGIQYKANKM